MCFKSNDTGANLGIHIRNINMHPQITSLLKISLYKSQELCIVPFWRLFMTNVNDKITFLNFKSLLGAQIYLFIIHSASSK